MDGKRIQVSREDVGLVMSYATRPDRLTEDLVDRMVNGVTGEELLEITDWIGLPQSTAIRLIDANREPTAKTAARGMSDARFRKALVGILVVMVLANVAFVSAAGIDVVGVVLVTAASAAVAWLVYRVIRAISTSSEARASES